MIEATLGAWLRMWHGTGEPQQYQFYRCRGCRRLVTHHIIRAGGCPCHESNKLSPTRLSLLEKLRLLVLPWTVTSLSLREESLRRTRLAAERSA